MRGDLVRSLVCIAGLSIALVGCGESSTGIGGSADASGTSGIGGADGTGGAGGLAGDACLDDLGVLGGIEDIEALVTDQCLLSSRGCVLMDVAPCVAECLEEEVALPQDCGLCIGLVTECILQDCIGDCTNPMSPQCNICIVAVTAQCNEVFEPCAGFPVP